MTTKFWIGILSSNSRRWPIQELVQAFSAAGSDLGVLALEGPQVLESLQGPGILCFSRLDDCLCDIVRSASNGGRQRIIALAASDMALDQNTVWQILEAGASDVHVFGCPSDTARHLMARFDRWSEIDRMIELPGVKDHIIGYSQAWRRVLRQAAEAARFTTASVLVLGESGTGKELVARLINDLDPRQCKPDPVTLDCSTITPELSGSEFFGHERGAFTGAVSPRDGAFGLAHRGTLFLDEVGELPTTLQAKLLRVIQEGAYKRVGGNAWQRTDFRLVAATNRDLTRDVARGTFRQDLYYRLAGCIIRLPPLCERREDIIPLAIHFLAQMAGGREPPALDDAVRDYLLSRDYPGNVRDLRQLVSRIAHRHVGRGPITVGDIPEEDRPVCGTRAATATWNGEPFENAIRYAIALGLGLRDISYAATDTAIRLAIHDERGNLQRAARRLGVTDRALQMRRAGQRCRQDATPILEISS